MQVTKIAALVAVACAGLGGHANAAMTPAQIAVIDNANTNGRVFFISGASATQKGFTSIINSLFVPASVIRFANNHTASSRDYEAVAGTLGAGAGPWSGQNVIIIDRVKGGSVWGVNPVARAESIETLVVKSANCGSAGAGNSTSPYTCDISDGTVAKPDQVPDVGISDVAPKLFQSPFNTEGETPAAALNASELAVFANAVYNKPIYTLAFGVPITNNTNPASLTRAAVSAIMTGNIGTWNQVDATLPADDILVCRRVQGSGTQAVDNLFFGNYPCGDVYNVPAARDASGAWDGVNYTVSGTEGGLVVVENSTSGDVRNCLTTAANPAGGSYATKDRDGNNITVTFAPKVGGHRAIGVLSMDSVGSSNAAGAWSFRSLDGAGTVTCQGSCPATAAPVTAGTGTFPTQANLMNGSWPLQGWVSWNVPTRTINNANKAPLAARFATVAQNPTVIAGINDLKHVAAALPAPFSAYSGANVSKAAYLAGNQCGPLNRNSAP